MASALGDIRESLIATISRPLPADVDDNIVNIKDELTQARHEVADKEKRLKSA
jgi:hypothetical protein